MTTMQRPSENDVREGGARHERSHLVMRNFAKNINAPFNL
jgi:hypothetical protein